MKVNVQPTWNGPFRIYFFHGGKKCVEFISNKAGDGWDRSHSKEALNLLESVYKVDRKNVRFV